MSGGPWPADRVISTINTYKHRAAQFRWQGRPMVSTFEGPGNAGDWPNIKHATECMFIPDWSSLSPGGIGSVLDTIDGAFSWDAWPVGAQGKTTASDEAWSKAIAGKPYMMPVSPWFYTNLPQWNKNWLWRGDDLWHDRWKQVIDFQPPLVQVCASLSFIFFHFASAPGANPNEFLARRFSAGMITGSLTISDRYTRKDCPRGPRDTSPAVHTTPGVCYCRTISTPIRGKAEPPT